MRSHFEKYVFLDQILVFFPNYIATVYAKLITAVGSKLLWHQKLYIQKK